MSTQQDIYAAGSENRPPMLNKENYVPWSSRLLRYAKSDADVQYLVLETFHEQTDDELTEAKIKQMEADDQAIQTILLGLPEDIYAAVDSVKLLRKSVQNVGNRVVQDAVQNQGVQNIGNQNGQIGVQNIGKWNVVDFTAWGCGLVVDAQKEEQESNSHAEEFDLLDAAADLDEIEEVNAKCNFEAILQQARHRGTQTDKALREQINALHLSSGKQITTLNEEISNLSKQLSTEKSTVSSLLEEKKKLKSDFKIREDEVLDKQIHLENKIKELDNILGLKAQRKQQSLYNGKVLLEKHDPPVVHDSEETLQLAQEKAAKFVRDFKSLAKEADESLAKHKTLELEIERLLRTVVPQKVDETNDLSKPVTSNSVPTPPESKIVKHDNVIAPGIFWINPFKPSREEKFMPNKHVKTSVRTKLIIVSQSHVITKNRCKFQNNVYLLKDSRSTSED
ncbi:hypothetical protein Tco_0373640 [Tanacetum coccineum]